MTICIFENSVIISFLNRICILVNGKDHLRILSKIVDNKTKEAYAKLAEVHNAIDDKVKFARDAKAGFLVSSPDEIGTGGFGIWCVRKEDEKKVKLRAKFGETVMDVIHSACEKLGEKKK